MFLKHMGGGIRIKIGRGAIAVATVNGPAPIVSPDVTLAISGNSATATAGAVTHVATGVLPVITAGPFFTWDPAGFEVITWNTDIASDSFIYLSAAGGSAGVYDALPYPFFGDPAFVTSHVVYVTAVQGLNPAEVRHCTLASRSAAGFDMAPAGDFMFTAAATGDVTVGILGNTAAALPGSLLATNAPVAFHSISPASPTWVIATNDITVLIPTTTRGIMMIPIGYTDNSPHTTSSVVLDPAGAATALTQVPLAAKSTLGATINSGYGGVDFWYLTLGSVTPGTYTVRVTADSGTPVQVGTAQFFQLVSQTAPIGAIARATGISASPTTSAIASNSMNMLVGACVGFMMSSGADLVSNDTQDLSTRETFGFTSAGLNVSHAQGSASHAMTWTNSSALYGWACSAVELVAG